MVAAGGALGASARYGVAQLVHVAPGSFPWATLWTNLTGSVALGFVLVVLLERSPPTRHVRPFVANGFLGAYTTYSTLAAETVVLAKDDRLAIAVAYTVASLVAGLLAVWIGMLIARTRTRLARGGTE